MGNGRIGWSAPPSEIGASAVAGPNLTLAKKDTFRRAEIVASGAMQAVSLCS